MMLEDKIDRYKEIGTDPYSSEKHMNLIKYELSKIQNNYPKKDQVDFLWTIMSRSGFGSHYSEEFAELVYACCYKSFDSELDKFIASFNYRNMGLYHKVKFMKEALNAIHKSQ